jgi:transcriptional regulator with PAS, ATPase and Fis domain
MRVASPLLPARAMALSQREAEKRQLEIARDDSVVSHRFDEFGHSIIGSSPRMRVARTLISKFANDSSTVLITGESGTGKKLSARVIHELSSRRDHAFVPVNCAAIPEELLDRELFGHVRGAFTGAANGRQGRFQLANGGTLFLDEIGEMSPKLQIKLLRVLQEHQFEPVGSDHAALVDVRVIAATNRDLRVEVREGRFREDLFYRLNVLPLELPSLRARVGDIPVLTHYLLQLHARRKSKGMLQIEASAMALLERYSWPGNVRELENLVERLVVLNDDTLLRSSDLPDYIVKNSVPPHHGTNEVRLPMEGVDLDGILENIENGFIEQALQRAGGNKTRAAELLNLNRTTFVERLRKKRMLQSARADGRRSEAVEKMTDQNFLGRMVEGGKAQ